VKLLDSLLDAIVRLEGDSLVMHVGEKPYVVTASSSMNAYRGPLAWGQVELSSRVLTFDAVSSMLGQILPADQQQALTEFGAIEHEIPSPAGIADKFTVVAARGGEDVWVEVRRRPIDVSKLQVTAEELAAANAATLADAHPHAEAPHQEVPAAAIEEPQPAAADTSAPAAAAAPEPVAVAVPGEAVTATEPAAEAAPEASLPEPEIEVITEAEAAAPAAEAPLDTNESIVVAIPGEAAEEFALSGVPDNAIQIVDEEPQGVPTEEEVDAMLGGASSELLNSGIIGGVVTEEPEPADEPVALVVDESFDEETEIDLTLQEPVTVSEPATPEPVGTMDAAPQAVAEVETPVHETPVHVDGPAF
jgi:hypothetical protein